MTNNRKIFGLAALGLIVIAVLGMSHSSSPKTGYIKGDLNLLDELRKGLPAHPSFYELSDVKCEISGDSFKMSANIKNKLEQSWAFEAEFISRTVSGRESRVRTGPGFWESGEVAAVETSHIASDYTVDSPCEVHVLHSPLLAYQDDKALKDIHEVLDRQRKLESSGR